MAKFQYTVYVPSLSREIFILELTTGQQKELIKSLQGNQNYEFVQNTNALLKEIISDQSLDIDNLTLVDKMLILMRLRSISIGDSVEYKFACQKCNKEIKTTVILSELITKLSLLKFPFTSCETENHYVVNCELPTVKTELAYEAVNKLKYDNTVINYGKFYGDMFIHDLAFFIKSILVPTQNNVEVVNLNEMSYPERCEVLKRLPSKLMQKVWASIKTTKRALNASLLSVTCPCKEKIVELNLNLNSPIYSAFLRSLFNENLHNVYQTIYYMVNVLHFPPQYVEDMVPGERALYWSYYKEHQERAKKGTQSSIDNLEPTT